MTPWHSLPRRRTDLDHFGLYRKKFTQRDIGHVVRSLVYFDEADREPPLRLVLDADWNEVKGDLRQQVERILA